MSSAFDIKRGLHKLKSGENAEDHRPYKYAEGHDSKARHILGLDLTLIRPSRNNSPSTPTNKLRSVTFSDATTAAGTPTEPSITGREMGGLSHKSSSSFLRKNRKSELQASTLTPKVSSSSLRSFYDKSRTPMSVSQQTSDSSSRDFALRKGTPSVISVATPESEHLRQMRVLTKSKKKSTNESLRHTSSVTKMSNASSNSRASSLRETNSDATGSVVSQPSASRISIYRPVPREETKEHASINQESQPALEAPVTAPPTDPARAKINVRRPKAGAKNWFDSLDSDSSDDEVQTLEPQMADEFVLEMKSHSSQDQVETKPPRSACRIPENLQIQVPLESHPSPQKHSQKVPDHVNKLTSAPTHSHLDRKRKIRMFEDVDLTSQSILYVGVSDDEDEEDTSSVTSTNSGCDDARLSVMRGPWDDVQIRGDHNISMTSNDSERLLQHLKQQRQQKPSVSTSMRSQAITYLEDCSTETITPQHDLLTSFPQTPTDGHSRNTSLRGSILSEDESIASTKLMNVTRQEESLIAAMRSRKMAMKKAETIAHRRSALMMLERENMLPTRYETMGGVPAVIKTDSPLRRQHTFPRSSAPSHNQRTDSVTTFQTDSVRQQSVRSSIATYLSEGSEDLQLPYSTIHGLPMGSSRVIRSGSALSDRPRRSRDTFLSEMSTTSTYTASPSEWSSNARDSHVVELDPLNRQMLREEIPSQLFMERPFLGWDARANMQTAH